MSFVPFSQKIFFTIVLLRNFAGAYHNKTGLNGQGLSDHMLFGSVVATTLVIVVTAQVKHTVFQI